VKDDEHLHFILTAPQQVDALSGRVLSTAVEQVLKRGLSVLRPDASDTEFVLTYAAMKAGSDSRGRPREFFGVSTFRAGDARMISSEKKIGVFATGMPDRPNHADVAAPKGTKIEEARAKKHIHDLINAGRAAATEFRGGRLIAQMPQ
jgi:hypothetical protein